MAHPLAVTCATFRPGTMRSTSGMFVAPDRRISSAHIPPLAAGTLDSGCSFFETEVTRVSIRSSRLLSRRPCGPCAKAELMISKRMVGLEESTMLSLRHLSAGPDRVLKQDRLEDRRYFPDKHSAISFSVIAPSLITFQ